MKTVKVKSPATSANLGCGFDSFGCAYSLFNTFYFTAGDGALSFEGVPEKHANKDNFAVLAFNKTVEKAGKNIHLEKLKIESEIPISRGLGSSSSLIVAGCVAANVFSGLVFSKEEIVEIATSIEGHPDNVAPCVYGGLTASCMSGEEIFTASFPISDSLEFYAVIPQFELSTSLCRKVLPQTVLFSDAVHNLSRIAPIIKGFGEGDEKALKFAVDDVLHQPYREKLIEGYDFYKKTAYECGASAFCISGAGPTMLVISRNHEVFGKIKEKLKNENVQILRLSPDKSGAVYEVTE